MGRYEDILWYDFGQHRAGGREWADTKISETMKSVIIVYIDT